MVPVITFIKMFALNPRRLFSSSKSNFSYKDAARVLNHVWLFATLWIVACPAPWDFPGKTPEWIAISSSRESSWLRDSTWISCVSCICRWIICCFSLAELLSKYASASDAIRCIRPHLCNNWPPSDIRLHLPGSERCFTVKFELGF